MWQLNLDFHVKPCEANACAGEGVVLARQHQRLPLLRLRILRLRLSVSLHPVQYPICVQSRMAVRSSEKRKIPSLQEGDATWANVATGKELSMRPSPNQFGHLLFHNASKHHVGTQSEMSRASNDWLKLPQVVTYVTRLPIPSSPSGTSVSFVNQSSTITHERQSYSNTVGSMTLRIVPFVDGL